MSDTFLSDSRLSDIEFQNLKGFANSRNVLKNSPCYNLVQESSLYEDKELLPQGVLNLLLHVIKELREQADIPIKSNYSASSPTIEACN